MRAEPTPPGLDVVQERGIALIAALMIMLLMSALMIGFTAVVMSDQRYRGIDKDRMRAYYGAQSGLEKLTFDFFNLYSTDVAMPLTKIQALATLTPTIPDVTFVAPTGVSRHTAPRQPRSRVRRTSSPTCSAQIGTGPYQGLMALKKMLTTSTSSRTRRAAARRT